MKKTKYSIGILSFLVVMSFCYFISYQVTIDRYNESRKQLELANETEKLRLVDNTKEDIITSDTKYVLETYNVNTREVTEEIIQVPIDFLGLTREKLQLYLKEYNDHHLEAEKGYINLSLVSFSREAIILRRTYEIIYNYYLVEEDGLVTVYLKDKQTVYEYTNIRLEYLPESLKEQIGKGLFIQDEFELYNFLENYTS